MADVQAGSEWDVNSESILRTIRHGRTSRDSWSATGSTTTPGSTRGPLGPWEPLVALLDPVHALTRLIVLDSAEDLLRDLW